MKKVLIALDYSPTAKKIADAGFSIAKAMDAEVTLVHVLSNPTFYSSAVYDPIMGFTGYPEFDPNMVDVNDMLKSSSQLFLEKTKEHLGDSKIKIIVVEGDYAEAILKTAKDIKADLVVIGTHSQKWLEKILIGSTTEDVLYYSTIPLLIVPTKN
jgi:nucleotide-binding universal stress UspA family protein